MAHRGSGFSSAFHAPGTTYSQLPRPDFASAAAPAQQQPIRLQRRCGCGDQHCKDWIDYDVPASATGFLQLVMELRRAAGSHWLRQGPQSELQNVETMFSLLFGAGKSGMADSDVKSFQTLIRRHEPKPEFNDALSKFNLPHAPLSPEDAAAITRQDGEQDRNGVKQKGLPARVPFIVIARKKIPEGQTKSAENQVIYCKDRTHFPALMQRLRQEQLIFVRILPWKAPETGQRIVTKAAMMLFAMLNKPGYLSTSTEAQQTQVLNTLLETITPGGGVPTLNALQVSGQNRAKNRFTNPGVIVPGSAQDDALSAWMQRNPQAVQQVLAAGAAPFRKRELTRTSTRRTSLRTKPHGEKVPRDQLPERQDSERPSSAPLPTSTLPDAELLRMVEALTIMSRSDKTLYMLPGINADDRQFIETLLAVKIDNISVLSIEDATELAFRIELNPEGLFPDQLMIAFKAILEAVFNYYEATITQLSERDPLPHPPAAAQFRAIESAPLPSLPRAAARRDSGNPRSIESDIQRSLLAQVLPPMAAMCRLLDEGERDRKHLGRDIEIFIHFRAWILRIIQDIPIQVFRDNQPGAARPILAVFQEDLLPARDDSSVSANGLTRQEEYIRISEALTYILGYLDRIPATRVDVIPKLTEARLCALNRQLQVIREPYPAEEEMSSVFAVLRQMMSGRSLRFDAWIDVFMDGVAHPLTFIFTQRSNQMLQEWHAAAGAGQVAAMQTRLLQFLDQISATFALLTNACVELKFGAPIGNAQQHAALNTAMNDIATIITAMGDQAAAAAPLLGGDVETRGRIAASLEQIQRDFQNFAAIERASGMPTAASRSAGSNANTETSFARPQPDGSAASNLRQVDNATRHLSQMLGVLGDGDNLPLLEAGGGGDYGTMGTPAPVPTQSRLVRYMAEHPAGSALVIAIIILLTNAVTGILVWWFTRKDCSSPPPFIVPNQTHFQFPAIDPSAFDTRPSPAVPMGQECDNVLNTTFALAEQMSEALPENLVGQALDIFWRSLSGMRNGVVTGVGPSLALAFTEAKRLLASCSTVGELASNFSQFVNSSLINCATFGDFAALGAAVASDDPVAYAEALERVMRQANNTYCPY